MYFKTREDLVNPLYDLTNNMDRQTSFVKRMPFVCPAAVSKISLSGGQGKLSHMKKLIFFSALLLLLFSQCRTERFCHAFFRRLPSDVRNKSSCQCMSWNLLLISLHCFYSNASSLLPSYWLIHVYRAFLSAWNTPVFCPLLFFSSQCMKTV